MDDNKDALSQSTIETPEVVEEKKDASDNLTPDHPRFKQVIEKLHEKDKTIDELKVELEKIKDQISQRQEDTGEQLTQDEVLALDKIDKSLRKERGYLTRDDLEREVRIERNARNLEKLSETYNGTNGYPKFIPEDVVSYAEENGFGSNYMAAYKQMHFDALVNLEAKKQNVTPPTSERPTGGERSFGEDLTSEKIGQMSDEEYEKKRETILSNLKKGLK